MDACMHHPTRCGRAARYKLPLTPLMNSPAYQPCSAQGWDSSCFCATRPYPEALTEQERSVLLTLEAPCKPSHTPAGTPGKPSPLGQGLSQSEPVLCCRSGRANTQSAAQEPSLLCFLSKLQFPSSSGDFSLLIYLTQHQLNIPFFSSARTNKKQS